MSNSLKKRIIKTIIIAVFLFVFISIFDKLTICKEDWLLSSFLEAISWAAGYFISETIEDKKGKIKTKEKIFIEIKIVVIVMLIIVFISEVLLSWSNSEYIIYHTCIPLLLAMLISN